MIFNVLQLLEKSAKKYPDKVALQDENETINYREYELNAKKIGTFISRKLTGVVNSPVAVLIDRNIRSICTFIGVVYSGNFYVPIDTSMPEERIKLILSTLNPVMVIDARTKALGTYSFINEYQYINIIYDSDIDEELLQNIREKSIDTDPLYSIFTSGSTGIPKGVLISHRGVIDLVNAFEDAFEFKEKTVFGNQAPFDFDVSVKDIYNALYVGGTVQVLPKKLFKTPKLLVDYLRLKEINTLIWAVSALRIIADFKALDDVPSLEIENVMFSGEVMPVKALNYWKEHVPNAKYVNLYGPTEITCNCTYFTIKKNFQDDDVIPIGKPFKNSRVFLISESSEIVRKCNELGEICVEGSCVGLGYYNNNNKTAEVFVQNPNTMAYDSRVYKTGDIGFYDEDGNLVFSSRKDHQIKHMGHRIELGEIEVALNALPFLTVACCVFDEIREKIICHYQAESECKKQIVVELSKKLPKYMWPNVYVHHNELPLNKNGKIDRVKLKEEV